MRGAEHRIRRQIARAATRRARRSACRSPSHRAPETTNARPGRWREASAAACRALRAPSRLSVGSPLIRKRLRVRRNFVGFLRAVAAALFADHEHEADPRLAVAPKPIGRRDLRRQDALGVARAAPVQPIAGNAAGKKGGTQSKCVEKTSCGLVRHRDDIEPRVVDTLLRDRPSRACAGNRPGSARFAFASGGRIDVDQCARQLRRRRRGASGSTLPAPCACRSANRGT